jgi:hypothetical protein
MIVGLREDARLTRILISVCKEIFTVAQSESPLSILDSLPHSLAPSRFLFRVRSDS